MTEKRTITGRCLCGECAFSIEVPLSEMPFPRAFCQCTSCRKGSGMLYYSILPWHGNFPDLSKLVKYDFSPKQATYHCKTCGSHVFEHRHSGQPDNKDPKTIGVTPGVLDNPTDLMHTTYHKFIADTKDGGFSVWLPSVDGKPIPRWMGHADTSEQIPTSGDFNRKETTADEGPPSSSPTLRARCLCGGVEFLVHRPTAEQVAENPWYIRSESRYLGGICVCTSCRLDAGFEVIPWLFLQIQNLSMPDGSPMDFEKGTLKLYKSSTGISRYHCSCCGATVFYWKDTRPDNIDVAVGLLEAESGVRAEDWLDWRTRLGYPEDIIDHKLLGALQEGMLEWGERTGHTFR